MSRWSCTLAAVAPLLLCPPVARAAAVDWQPATDIARGAGERGAWQQNDSRYDFVDDGTAAWLGGGELAVAWVDQRRKAVLLRRHAADGAATADAPLDVSRQPHTFSWLPRLATAPDAPQRVYALWQEIVFSGGSHGGEMLLAVSDDGGRSFARPLNLSRSRAGDGKGRLSTSVWHNGSYDIAAGPGGQVLATWTEYDGRLWLARSGDAGRTFARAVRLAGEPPARPARAPALAVGAGGVVVLAWTTGEDSTADIQVARSTDGGATFGPPRPAAVTPGRGDAPKLAFDSRGVLHLVHGENGGGSDSAGAPVAPSAIRHLRSIDGGRSFGPAQELSRPLPPGTTGAAFPALGVDAHGRVVVTWELLRGVAPQRPYGLGFAVSDDGVRFSAAEPVPGSTDAAGGFNGSTQGLLTKKLAVRSDGELAIVASAVKIGSHSRVWLLRGKLR